MALKIIGMAGLASTIVVAPNAVQALDKLLKKNKVKGFDRDRLIKELRRQNLVIISTEDETIKFNLTPAGAYRLQNVLIDEIQIKKPKKWDRKWRIVSYDIPKKLANQRKYFLDKLNELGFEMINHSLWVSPYPCFEAIEQLAGHYNILRYCRLIEADRLDELTTAKLVRRFNLKV